MNINYSSAKCHTTEYKNNNNRSQQKYKSCHGTGTKVWQNNTLIKKYTLFKFTLI